MSIVIRAAGKGDIKDIVEMNSEYTEYLASLGQINGPSPLSVEELIRDSGLDPNRPQHPLFSSYIVNEVTAGSCTPIAFASYCNNYSTWEGKSLCLISFYVREKHRGKGVGKQLLIELARHAKRTNCRRIDFYVNQNNPATKFGHYSGAINLTEAEEWQVYQLNTDDQLIID